MAAAGDGVVITYRPMALTDVGEVSDLLMHYLTHQEPRELAYPALGTDGPLEIAEMLRNQLMDNADWWAICAVDGSRTVGVIIARMDVRLLGYPKRVQTVDAVVVHPDWRRKNICRSLVNLAVSEGWERGAQVYELAWSPHSIGDTIWPKYGYVPYRTMVVWLNEDGTPRKGNPM